jgi:hypothetical protein
MESNMIDFGTMTEAETLRLFKAAMENLPLHEITKALREAFDKMSRDEIIAQLETDD